MLSKSKGSVRTRDKLMDNIRMSSDWLRVALLLSKISSSIGSFGMVFKTNKLAPRMFIHDHHVENERSDDEEDERILAKLHLNKTSHTCQHHAEITQSHTFAALIRLSTTTHNLLTFNISEILSNNLEKLGLLANKHLWTFLSHSSYASSRM